MDPSWLRHFPDLDRIEDGARNRLLAAGRRVRIPRGGRPFRSGDPCENYLFLTEGGVRVQMVAESGREIVLYRVGPGETCILTTACLLGRDDYPAEARAETETEAVVLASTAFRDLLATSADFRDFVFRAYGRRLAALMALIEEVVFRRLDLRLGDLLLRDADGDGAIAATHHELAVELGSAREVVSRLLKDFERRGWIELGRGRIQVADAAALRAFLHGGV